jgi:hypothetical protein
MSGKGGSSGIRGLALHGGIRAGSSYTLMDFSTKPRQLGTKWIIDLRYGLAESC